MECLSNNKSFTKMCVKCTIAISLISTCCFGALIGTKLDTADDVIRFSYELYAKFNTADCLNSEGCDDWIKQEKYKDSIFKDIPEATTDCFLGTKRICKNPF